MSQYLAIKQKILTKEYNIRFQKTVTAFLLASNDFARLKLFPEILQFVFGFTLPTMNGVKVSVSFDNFFSGNAGLALKAVNVLGEDSS